MVNAGSAKEVATIVRDSLVFYDGKKYELNSWVIMPNHGHVLLTPMENEHLPDILHSIKSYTALKANRFLGRKGQFWQHESFDRYIRDQNHYSAVIRYIENNPVKAGLCSRPEEWQFGSAYERGVN
jgi:REP element-mobilizing transposase RayT